MLTPADWHALALTLRLAGLTTVLLLVVSLPLAWWLGRGNSAGRALVHSLVALPLVLPPTVLGLYLLLVLGAQGPVGALVPGGLAFTFTGLVIGSMCYSLPFVVQPLVTGFAALEQEVLDAAASLGAGPIDRFCRVALPQIWPSLLGALVLGFAHTIGEFGVVVMIGGSLPGETLVASVAIFEYVESGRIDQAHDLALVLLGLSGGLLLIVYGLDWWRRRRGMRR